MKKFVRSGMAIMLALCMVAGYGLGSESAYGASSVAATGTVKAKSITLNHKVYTIKKGSSIKLKATILPSNVSKKNKKITWTSSNKKVATVRNGKVTGKKNGKATITAKVNGKKATCTIYVGKPVRQANFSLDEVTLTQGQKDSAEASVLPGSATIKALTYKTSNKSVATIDKNGIITAVGPGTATITATPKDESGKSATLKVTVDPPFDIRWTAYSAWTTMEYGTRKRLMIEYIPNTTRLITDLRYTSNDESVVAVDNDGITRAYGNGKATITAIVTDKYGNVRKLDKDITVSTPVTGVSIEPKGPSTIKVGETLNLTTIVYPCSDNKKASNTNVTFTSDRESVATVDSSGKVTGVGLGIATITVITEDGGKTETHIVNVLEELGDDTGKDIKEDIGKGAEDVSQHIKDLLDNSDIKDLLNNSDIKDKITDSDLKDILTDPDLESLRDKIKTADLKELLTAPDITDIAGDRDKLKARLQEILKR